MGIRLGIIGTGRIAVRAVKEIRETRAFDLTAVMNPHEKHAVEFAGKYGIDAAYADVDAMAEAVDAVYIASPHATHASYSRSFLQREIHVLCEKPFSFCRSEAEKLYVLADEKKRILMEAVKTAYCPGFHRLEEVIAGGTIGDVVDVEAAFTRLTPFGGREFTDRATGGAFTEFGTYAMLPVLRFLGTGYREISFQSRNAKGVDGYTKAFFQYGDRFGTAKTGLTVKSEGQLLISGTGGYVLAPSPWWLTRGFVVRYEDANRVERYECEFAGDGLRYEFREFAARIHGEAAQSTGEREEILARADIFERFLKDRPLAEA